MTAHSFQIPGIKDDKTARAIASEFCRYLNSVQIKGRDIALDQNKIRLEVISLDTNSTVAKGIQKAGLLFSVPKEKADHWGLEAFNVLIDLSQNYKK